MVLTALLQVRTVVGRDKVLKGKAHARLPDDNCGSKLFQCVPSPAICGPQKAQWQTTKHKLHASEVSENYLLAFGSPERNFNKAAFLFIFFLSHHSKDELLKRTTVLFRPQELF